MDIKEDVFGIFQGEEVTRFTICNRTGMEVQLSTFGAGILSIKVPDKNNNLGEVVLGFTNFEAYLADRHCVGVLIGRYANRIKNASFTLEDHHFSLTSNEGSNHLHGGFSGFQKKNWKAGVGKDEEKCTIRMVYKSDHLEEGYPGNLNIEVRFIIFDTLNRIDLMYTATSDQDTIINITHHEYWNLKDGGASTILDHDLQICSNQYTPFDHTNIPTGKIENILNTPLDFSKGQRIGEAILRNVLKDGFNHNFILDKELLNLSLACRLTEETSGRQLEIWTTQPGLQLYTGAFLPALEEIKPYHGLCLETQHFPDSVHHEHFPTTVLKADQIYKEECSYRFGIEHN